MNTGTPHAMRLVFLGAGSFACPALRALADRPGAGLAAVYTQPDRPRGRRLESGACPVCEEATELGLTVRTPQKIGAPEVVAEMADLRPDVLVVVDYGQFLPSPILAVPRLGAINIHPSLLPRYRGAAPIQHALANGDAETGVSILYVTPEMDAGDIILQEPVRIRADDTAVTLGERLSEIGADLLDRALDLFAAGPPTGKPQNPAEATFAPKLTKADARIDWTQPAETIRNRVRAFQPWPGCETEAPAGSGRRLKLLAVDVAAGQGEPGLVEEGTDGFPLVSTGKDSLRLATVQPEGRRPMAGNAWMCGYVRTRPFRLGS